MAPAAYARTTEPVVRTFRAADVRAALAAVKATLGPDAVILSTREYSEGRFGEHGVEVAAAVGIDVSGAALRDEGGAGVPRLLEESSRAAEHALVERGFELGLARELVRRALAAGAGDEAAIARAVRAVGARRLVAGRAPWLRGGPRILALVGPPGVGKTTTVAKIAARAVLESRLDVALITIDTWRIAASDHLLRYGQLLRVPAHVAKDRAALTDALERTARADLVLIDTAGRSGREALETQAAMLHGVPGISLLLAAPATASAADLGVIADRYRPVGPAGAIVTRIDEAAAPGGLLSAFVRLPLPVACLTDGQRVPEDIRPCSGESLVNLVFGAPADV